MMESIDLQVNLVGYKESWGFAWLTQNFDKTICLRHIFMGNPMGMREYCPMIENDRSSMEQFRTPVCCAVGRDKGGMPPKLICTCLQRRHEQDKLESTEETMAPIVSPRLGSENRVVKRDHQALAADLVIPEYASNLGTRLRGTSNKGAM